MPMPSRKDTTMPFLEATDSARAKMIANTTTKSRYTPNALYKSGAKAWRNNCTQVTIVAIQVIYTGTRTFLLIVLRIIETTTLLQVITNQTVRPMVKPLITLVVTARPGHKLRANTKYGFSSIMPLLNIFHKLMISDPLTVRPFQQLLLRRE